MLGFVFFAVMFLAGDYLSTRFALPIPGSIIGLGLALCVLAVRGKVDAALKDPADLLLRYLPVFLIPIGVGLIRIFDAPPTGLWRLVAVLVVALVLAAVGTAKITESCLAVFFRRPSDGASRQSAGRTE